MKYIASCSFGKDSIATILLAIQHNEPLDEAIFCEVMFDKQNNISGEIPEHIEWVYGTAIPKLQSMGVPVKVVRSEKDYLYFFRNAVGGGKYAGKLYGFPVGGRCVINRDCKVAPIRRYFRGIEGGVTTYVGIAIDETKRLARLKDNRISLLEKYGYTEQMAYDLCEAHGLLSPIYKVGKRNGCWFCPNATIASLSHLRKAHPELWEKIEKLSHTPNLCSYGFKYGKTVQQIAEKMDKYDNKIHIKCVQLSLFDDVDTLGGGICSMEHPKPRRAKYRVFFKNGNYRDVCGWCVKKFQEKGSYAYMVERVEKITKK